ncbi:MAG: enoyl-CoA hydratase/isomerase family protein [Microlunatus sp.]|nr:enoyl-CoA hydratase/isomerase family protein [Microlunatus sp.]
MSDLVRLEVSDGVATLRIDRPDQLNALNTEIQAQIATAAREAARRDDVAAVVLTGGEKVFAAGADVKEMARLSYAEMAAQSARILECFDAVATIPKPVIAAINGYALGGGCELALCADVRYAADDATLGQPEIKLGVIPGGGGTQRLARLVGPSRAKELIFSGRFVRAEEALRIGLVDKLLPAADVYPEAAAWAQQFVGGPRLALAAAKQAIDLGWGVGLGTGLEIERQLFSGLFATEDRSIGMQSFVDEGPGKARFVGR